MAAGCGGGNDDGTGGSGNQVAEGESREGGGEGEEAGGAVEGGGGAEGGGSAPGSPGQGGEGGGESGANGGSSGGAGQNGSLQGGAPRGGTGKGGSSGNGSANGGPGPGGGESGQSAPTGSPARQKFIKEADAVCTKWGAKIKKDVLRGFEGDLNGSSKEIKEGIQSLVEALKAYVIPDLEDEIKAVQNLDAPADAEGAVTAASIAIQELIELSEADAESLILTGKGATKPEERAKKQGFTACGTLVGEQQT